MSLNLNPEKVGEGTQVLNCKRLAQAVNNSIDSVRIVPGKNDVIYINQHVQQNTVSRVNKQRWVSP